MQDFKVSRYLRGLWNAPRLVAAGVISLYQAVLSPDHSWLAARFPYGYCRHYPSCSEYSRQSFLRFGFIKGFLLSAQRVARCHPWAEPSFDPIPKQ